MGLILGIIIGISAVAGIGWFVYAKMMGKTGSANKVALCVGLVALALFLVVPFSVKTINTGEVAVVKVWGKAQDVKEPGTHFNFWLGKEYIRYDTKIRQIDSQAMAYSQDAQTMDMELNIQYRIQVDKVLQINEEFGSLAMLEARITSVCEERTKATMSSMQAMQIIESRDSLSAKVIENIEPIAETYYVDIVNVVIANIDFSDAFEQAVENKMISEQQQLQAEYEAKKAETEAKGKLEVAKLEAEAELARAQKEAEATEVRAEAEANALKIMQDAWDSISPDVQQVILKEMAIEKWDGKMPETMVGSDFIEYLMGAIGSGNSGTGTNP